MLVKISARKLTIPPRCVCCLADPDASFDAIYTRQRGKRVITTDTRSWTFPYCTRCVGHAKAYQSIGAGAFATWLLGVPLTIVFAVAASAVGLVLGVTTFVVASLLTSRHRNRVKAQQCTPHCASPGWAVRYLGWDGSVQAFHIESRPYAAQFARANMHKLVGVSQELQDLLRSDVLLQSGASSLSSFEQSRATIGNQLTTRAPGTERQGDLLLHWIDRIESLKGPVARRNALNQALAELHDPAARRQLLVEASRIELRAVLDKVDSLKTPAAKKRHLQAAIEQVRHDDIPDELQTCEIAMLERALADAEAAQSGALSRR
jgi:hypothetical protein